MASHAATVPAGWPPHGVRQATDGPQDGAPADHITPEWHMKEQEYSRTPTARMRSKSLTETMLARSLKEAMVAQATADNDATTDKAAR